MSVICQVSGVIPLTASILKIFLTPESSSAIPYEAGQYVVLELSDQQSLPFSIANSPLCGASLEFHIRHTKDNPFTERLLQDIAEQRSVRVHEPQGTCTYRSRDPAKPCLLLAGGTGFAPIKAIIEEALTHHVSQALHLYWAARSVSELYCLELATHWSQHVEQFRFTPIISNPAPNWSGLTGLLPRQIQQDYADLSGYQVFAAGPSDFVLSSYAACLQLQLPKENFHSDLFSFMAKPE